MEFYKNLVGIAPKLNIGFNLAQFLSFIVIFAFAIVGTLLVVLAYPAQWLSLRYGLFVEFDAFVPEVILIIAGVVMLFISVFGGIATIARSSFIVNLYLILLLLLLIVEINVGITTFIVHGNLYSSIKSNMIKTMNNQTEEWSSSYIMDRWDYMQDQLSCCGVHYAYDWAPSHIDGPEVETSHGSHYYTVPYSCCIKYFKTKFCDLPKDGCFAALSYYVSNISAFIGYIALAIVISQLLGLVFAILLLGTIRRLKTEEEMKRQEIQHLIYADLHKPEEEKPLLLTSSSSNA